MRRASRVSPRWVDSTCLAPLKPVAQARGSSHAVGTLTVSWTLHLTTPGSAAWSRQSHHFQTEQQGLGETSGGEETGTWREPGGDPGDQGCACRKRPLAWRAPVPSAEGTESQHPSPHGTAASKCRHLSPRCLLLRASVCVWVFALHTHSLGPRGEGSSCISESTCCFIHPQQPGTRSVLDGTPESKHRLSLPCLPHLEDCQTFQTQELPGVGGKAC